ncbi:unnamed protein product [Phyllotreta striolata]|uniref:Uncharacterized protein n=1 Tax=Phyllotreta striolata TaxID=444603 RepID=A0A9N9TZ95_PHYSR|nr:unnamed protein product [Phyllotreta striolata]
MAERKEHPKFFRSLRNYFREYCRNTSIHGFRYFGENRTYFERVWWFLVFGVTLAACVMSIREVYNKWLRSPVIVSFATKGTPIYTIPFPAVTICPTFKSVQAIYSHTNIIKKLNHNVSLTEKERKILDYMGLICDSNKAIKHSDIDYFTDDFYETLKEVNRWEFEEGSLMQYGFSPQIKGDEFPFGSCTYLDVQYNPCVLFKPVITDEGICYTFNMLDKREIFKEVSWIPKEFYNARKPSIGTWTLEGGYSDEAGLFPYPKRAMFAGATSGLTVKLFMPKNNKDHSCKQGNQGFRVSLHLPSRIPRPSQDYFRVPLDQTVMAAINPEMTATDSAVEKYSPSKRECYFPNEKKLRFFKLYTAKNCQLECQTNYTLRFCDCVNFFMPRENGTKMCGISKLGCMQKAYFSFRLGDNLRNKLGDRFQTNERAKKLLKRYKGCDCLPTCTDLTYNVVTSQSPWDVMESIKAERMNWSAEIENDDYYVSKLILFFKSSSFVTSERHELYGPTDFLANFGGLLGLFTGFSILSLMEAIYFLTVRLCCNSRAYGYWAGPEN